MVIKRGRERDSHFDPANVADACKAVYNRNSIAPCISLASADLVALFGDNRILGFNHRGGYAEKLDQGSEAYHDVKRSRELRIEWLYVMC